MEPVEERHRMTESVGMTAGWTWRTYRTHAGTIVRAVIGTVAIVRTMIVAWAVVAVTGTVMIAWVAWAVIAVTRTIVRTGSSTGTVVVALIARTVLVALVAGAILLAAVLMAIIRSTSVRRTRRTLACSVARMASVGLPPTCLRINYGSGEHSHSHNE